MKRILLTIAALFIMALPALSKDLVCTWDKSTTETWDEVRIYERTGTTLYIYQRVALVTGDLVTARITNVDLAKVHTYVARSFLNGLESADSNAISIGGTAVAPTAPKTFKVVAAP